MSTVCHDIDACAIFDCIVKQFKWRVSVGQCFGGKNECRMSTKTFSTNIH